MHNGIYVWVIYYILNQLLNANMYAVMYSFTFYIMRCKLPLLLIQSTITVAEVPSDLRAALFLY